jgi:hypothetical protein
MAEGTFITSVEERGCLVKIIFNEFCLPELSSDVGNKRISVPKDKT